MKICYLLGPKKTVITGADPGFLKGDILGLQAKKGVQEGTQFWSQC